MTPDKFFSNYVFFLKLTFFGTRFEKIGWRGDILESGLVKEIRPLAGQKIGGAYVVTCHSLESSICVSLARHLSAFSGLFQAS
jgi:hypothetical protein